jgi:hypothetical protein
MRIIKLVTGGIPSQPEQNLYVVDALTLERIADEAIGKNLLATILK